MGVLVKLGLGLIPSLAGSWEDHFLLFNLSFLFCKIGMITAPQDTWGTSGEKQRAQTGNLWATSNHQINVDLDVIYKIF